MIEAVDRACRTGRKQLENNKITAFKKDHPNWFTMREISEATEISASRLSMLVKEHNIPRESHGRCVLYNVEDFYLKRQVYEDDIIAHDGERPGPVKFFGDRLYKMLEK